MPASLRPFSGLALLAIPALLAGCATLQSWFRSAGTYAVAAPTPRDLDGRGEVLGSLYLTPSLSNVMMEGRDPPPFTGLPTTVAVEPLGLALETNPMGQFFLPRLVPGEYQIAFQDPGGREIWAEFAVEADQHLEVVVWVQWNGTGQWAMSEGTSPRGMFPGANGAYSISSGSGSSRGRGGGEGDSPGAWTVPGGVVTESSVSGRGALGPRDPL